MSEAAPPVATSAAQTSSRPPTIQNPSIPLEIIRYVATTSASLPLVRQIPLLCRSTRTLLFPKDVSQIVTSYFWFNRSKRHPLHWYMRGQHSSSHISSVPTAIALETTKQLLLLGADPRTVWDDVLDFDPSEFNWIAEYAIEKGCVEVARLSLARLPAKPSPYWGSSIRRGLILMWRDENIDFDVAEDILDFLVDEGVALNCLYFCSPTERCLMEFWETWERPLMNSQYRWVRELITGFNLQMPEHPRQWPRNGPSASSYHTMYNIIGKYSDVETFQLFLNHGMDRDRAIFGVLGEGDNLSPRSTMRDPLYDKKPNEITTNVQQFRSITLLKYLLSCGLDPNIPNPKYDDFGLMYGHAHCYGYGNWRNRRPYCLFELAVGVGNLDALRVILEARWRTWRGMNLVGFRLPGSFAAWKPVDLEWYQELTTLLLNNDYTITKEDVQPAFEHNSPEVAFHILQAAPSSIKNDPYFLFLATKLPTFPNKLSTLQYIISLADPAALFRTKKHPNQALEIIVRDWEDNECLQTVKFFVENGIRLNGDACPALLEAAKKGKHDVMEMLLEGGANPNGCNGRVVQTAYGRDDKVALRLLERYGAVLNVIGGRGRRRVKVDGEEENGMDADDMCGVWH
ncbi:hypothetical protein HDV00_004387 [Rhizophlyctis rosea]|nr:hypothetical protein HDV00_004387 [Rhizophlyctis rosea]